MQTFDLINHVNLIGAGMLVFRVNLMGNYLQQRPFFLNDNFLLYTQIFIYDIIIMLHILENKTHTSTYLHRPAATHRFVYSIVVAYKLLSSYILSPLSINQCAGIYFITARHLETSANIKLTFLHRETRC